MNISFAAPLDADARAFLSEETGVDFRQTAMAGWLCATARNDHGAVVGVLTADPKRGFDYHLSAAVSDPACLSRRLLSTIFKTIFTRAARITALVEPGNDRSIAQLRRMGFLYEGFLRRGLDGSRDALVFGLLPADCPFLLPKKGDGHDLKDDRVSRRKRAGRFIPAGQGRAAVRRLVDAGRIDQLGVCARDP